MLFAEELNKRFGLEKIRFTNSGTEVDHGRDPRGMGGHR